ncbi:MAG: beta-ketoacyl-ACP synthase II [Eubacteriales bacterium]
MKRRVVITGMGAVTPIGNNVPEAWENVKAGVCGIDTISFFDASQYKVTMAAEVKNLKMEDYLDKGDIKRHTRFVQFALIAAKEAMAQSGLVITEENAPRCGTLISSGIGCIGTIMQEHNRGMEKGYERISPFFIPTSITNMAAGAVALQHGLKGKCTCVVTACAGGTNAVGDAFQHVRDGYAEVMFCGGTEAAITEMGIGGFSSLRALSNSKDKDRASIPFDADRDGFVMGEGAGILVLEELEHALARGATIYGEVFGYGSTCDAYHMTAPDPESISATNCILQAMADGGISPESIDYINAHGTSTPLNDKGETLAIKKAFGEEKAKKLAISSTKAMTGHLLGAAGAVELIFTILAAKEDFLPATINYQKADPDCDLDIVPNQGRNSTVNYAISNSLGFGGHNAAVLVGKYQEKG